MAKQRKTDSLWRDAFRRLLKNRIAVIGGIFILVLAFIAVFAPVIAPYHYADGDFAESFSEPGGKYVMGADFMGRDMLSRMLAQIRCSRRQYGCPENETGRHFDY